MKSTSSAQQRDRGIPLLHPVRMRIVMALGDRDLTPRELHEVLPDVPQASLYRHLTRLEVEGAISVVDSRRVRGTLERTFGLRVPSESAADGGFEDDPLTSFMSFVNLVIADVAAHTSAASWDEVGYRQVGLWLDDDENSDLVAAIGELLAARLSQRPRAGRRRWLLTTILLPDEKIAT
jgi:DNA-binding transcriptional ArsR family regulator